MSDAQQELVHKEILALMHKLCELGLVEPSSTGPTLNVEKTRPRLKELMNILVDGQILFMIDYLEREIPLLEEFKVAGRRKEKNEK
jgi:hypothetical protein